MPIYIDISKCIGCRTCEAACQIEHEGQGRLNVHYVEDLAAVPIFCHQCEAACCATICLPGALKKDGELMIFDEERCTGCGLCAFACPFGVVWIDRIAHKCDLCRDRDGGPACVAACPAQALFDDFEEAMRSARLRTARALMTPGGVR
jgi:formate dehydrogenase iron-sulfur subunit